MDQSNQIYTITEAAKILGIHERNIKDLIRQGWLETVKIGDTVKVTKESMDNVPSGYLKDPNPDQEIKKQKNRVSENFATQVSENFELQQRDQHMGNK